MATARKRLTRDESQAQTRERILLAARAVVARNGFAGASVRDIAEEAGYSQGALYSNFSGKEPIMLELLRQHMREEAEQLQAIVKGSDGAASLDRLGTWAGTLNSEVDWSMLALELQLLAHRSPTFAADYDEVHEAHAKNLGQIVAEFYRSLGREPQLDPRELAAGCMALAHGLALQRRKDSEAPAGRLIMTFLGALLADAKPSESPGSEDRET
ncbi:MAG: TetR/AcrR family transcriptional regulator [Pseudomonadota bacterium]|uniref:TetR/AcrR family transcriptional regulator n=1 Tax=unclassified Phenylobacterium TaxID=2640670 RepID=UPI0006F7E94B|nr:MULTISPECIES: TetR/AcrR family transcriptional regulator [unclassified Phenylobacterium]KRB42472.1 TetR family transcriptional regulator [Phenylobacterium sp. Root700]MBT9471682.1 TetR/AcrR family transcriptional regulator [Phenylobacterium sp.]